MSITEYKKLLEEWKEDASTLLRAYFAKAELYRKRNLSLGITTVILSSIVGTAVFSSIGEKPETYIQIIVGLTSLFAAVIAALHSFLNLDEVAEKYHQSGAGYAAIRKEIEELLASIEIIENEILITNVSTIREKWNNLRETSFPMSSKTLSKYRIKNK